MAAAEAWKVQIDKEKKELEGDPRKEATAWTKLSIYRVPTHMCNANGTAFTPQVVSLGPYHHGESPLSLMEAAKHRALVHLLQDTDKSVNDYLRALRDCREKVMEAYEQLDKKWQGNPEEFLRMMVLDGCFVIEVLRKNFANYAFNDPVFSELRQPTIIQYLRRDLLLLENQLPLAVLEAIVEIATGSKSNISSLLLEFCFPDNEEFEYEVKGVHMLDVARQSMLRKPDNMKSCMFEARAAMNVKSNEVRKKSETKLVQAWISLKLITKKCWCGLTKLKDNDISTKNSNSAKELHQVGIKFQRSESNSLRGIKFEGDDLQLPTITINHNSESMFLNFIAFEQLHLSGERFTTSYFLFMGGLITSIEDVKLLRDNEIIECPAAYEITVERMIKKLTEGLSFSENDELYIKQQELNKYYVRSEKRCKRKAKTWYSTLCDTHFASPWTIIKLAAGVTLLGLTTVGTIYTILQLYKGNH